MQTTTTISSWVAKKINLAGNKTYLKRYDLLHHKVERILSEAPVVSSKIVSKYSGGLQYLLKV